MCFVSLIGPVFVSVLPSVRPPARLPTFPSPLWWHRELAVAKGVLQFASKASLRDANSLLEAYKVTTQAGTTAIQSLL